MSINIRGYIVSTIYGMGLEPVYVYVAQRILTVIKDCSSES